MQRTLSILLALVLASAVAAQVTVEKVRPSKILYDFGEPITVEVTLKNAGATAQAGDVTAVEEWDLSEARTVWTGKVEVPAGESKAVSVSYKATPPMFGRALRVSFAQGGKVVASGVEFYQVADPARWFRCMLINAGGTASVTAGDSDPFQTYSNYVNHFAYAVSDFAGLAPTVESWYSAQGNYGMSKERLLKQIAAYKRNGLRAGAYTNLTLGGPFGYELARQHPEWILRDQRGAFDLTVYRALDPVDLTTTVAQRRKAWYPLYPDLGNPEVVKIGIQSLLDSIEMFGWNSMFFDGVYSIPDGWQKEPTHVWDGGRADRGRGADAVSTECVKAVRDALRKAYPNLALWYNGSVFGAGDQLKEAHWASMADTNCGALLEVQGAQMNNPNYYGHNWRAFFEALLGSRKSMRKMPGGENAVLHVGYLYNMDPWRVMSKEEFAASRDTWNTANTLTALMMGSGFHPCVLCSDSFRPGCQFMTRFSALLWAQDLQPVAEPWKRMMVNSNREVWWEDSVCTREDKSRKDTIIGVVNTPAEEQFSYKTAVDPPAARRVEVEFTTATPAAKVQVWALAPYAYGAAQAPTQVQLKPVFEGGKLYVELPPVNYYAMVVIRERKG